MKLQKLLGLVLISILLIPAAYACEINFTVKNQTERDINGISLQGPCMRHSGTFSLKPGEEFKYQSTGSFCSCHGEWRLFATSIREWERVGTQQIDGDG